MKIFKAFSALLSYPSPELQEAVPEIRAVVAASLVHADDKAALEPLLDALAGQDLYDLQEGYVLLFDRSRTLSLNLFEHIHGESRDRGGAMVDLLQMYRAAGFDLDGYELPDHLPVLLEFLSTQSRETAHEVLSDAGHILVALAERLQRRGTPYAAVLQALVRISAIDPVSEEAEALLSRQDDNPEDLAALDAVWEEAQVTFGPDTRSACSSTPPAGGVPIRIHPARVPAAQRINGGS